MNNSINIGSSGLYMFFSIIFITLLITFWSSRQIKSSDSFYTADGEISGPMNGFAISGDFLSATTLLGITGLFFTTGMDSLIYLASPLFGLLLMFSILAGPIRRLGKFTLADILTSRFKQRPMRLLSASNTLVISIFYLVVQLVGAGALIQTIFGIDYIYSVIMVGFLMTAFVTFGGMVATTWVQIVKAWLLIAAVAGLCFLIMLAFNFDITRLTQDALSQQSLSFFGPGPLLRDGFSSLSLAAGLLFGMCGLPHILIRFFTVPSESAAKTSVAVATIIITLVFLAIFLFIGPAAVALLTGKAATLDPSGNMIGGNNMAILHLANLVGGKIFTAFMAAVVFATILAVVSGLTIASVGALSQDIYAELSSSQTRDDSDNLAASRYAALIVGGLSIICAIAFEGQNLAYLVGLVFAISASANFPILLMALYDENATTKSVIAVGIMGLISSLALVIAGPSVWVEIFGFSSPLLNLPYPALVSMAASLLIWILYKPKPLILMPRQNNSL